jgi:hypothetical protein
MDARAIDHGIRLPVSEAKSIEIRDNIRDNARACCGSRSGARGRSRPKGKSYRP